MVVLTIKVRKLGNDGQIKDVKTISREVDYFRGARSMRDLPKTLTDLSAKKDGKPINEIPAKDIKFVPNLWENFDKELRKLAEQYGTYYWEAEISDKSNLGRTV